MAIPVKIQATLMLSDDECSLEGFLLKAETDKGKKVMHAIFQGGTDGIEGLPFGKESKVQFFSMGNNQGMPEFYFRIVPNDNPFK